MKFECLIEILKEKGYIEYKDIYAKGIIIGHTIKSNYNSVINKIVEEIPDEYITYRYQGLHLTTVKAIEEFVNILYEDDDEDMKLNRFKHKFFIRSNRTELPKSLMIRAFRQSKRYKYDYDTEAGIVCINIETRDNAIRERKRKEAEVEDFINSLP